MDGHERADVVRYRNDTFLPAMSEFEARMVHYEGLIFMMSAASTQTTRQRARGLERMSNL